MVNVEYLIELCENAKANKPGAWVTLYVAALAVNAPHAKHFRRAATWPDWKPGDTEFRKLSAFRLWVTDRPSWEAQLLHARG